MASIKEVAIEAKVSFGTVSKVLNERADANIPTATRERIRAAAHRVGYHPNAIARGLSRKRMDTVGLVMAYNQNTVTADSYLGPCLDGILRINKQRRQKTMVFTADDWNEAAQDVPSYCDGHCDGLLLIIPRLNTEAVSALQARHIPLVLVGDSRDVGVATVDVDNVAVGQAATQHLLDLGHRRIAAFLGYPEFCSSEQRLAGYREALEAACLWEQAQAENWIVPCGYNRDAGYAAALQFLKDFPNVQKRPTAIFCFSDRIALGVLNALQEQGITVPNDISVIGVDDVPAAQHATPPLTTLRQDVSAIGERAAEILLDLIDKKVAQDHREWIVPQLILRSTTAPPTM